MTYNMRKQKTPNHNSKKKKELKKKRIVQGASETTSSVPTFISWGCWQEKIARN